MNLAAVSAGSVTRVSQVNGVEDARSVRQRDIIRMLQEIRQVDVNDLVQRFGVSGMTIRRAPAYGSRAAVQEAEKAAIARAVAKLVEPGAAIGIDSGTTCHAVAAQLAHRNDLTVVTNALHAAITARAGGTRVIVLGGLLTPELSLVNPGTTQEPPPVHLDLLILGCGGLSIDRGITYFDPAEVQVRSMLARLADRVVVAADHTKFDHKKAMVLGPLDLIDVLVTDQTPPEPLRNALTAADTDIVVAT